MNGTVTVLTPSNNNSIFSETAKLTSGMAFGELALLKNQPRSASIKCIEPAHFMILSKENYLKILGKSDARKLEEIVEFLHSVSIFTHYSKRALDKLSYYFKSHCFSRNQIVYKENDIAESVYIVKSGEFELSKNSIELKNQDSFYKYKASKATKSSKRSIIPKIALLGKGEIFGDEEILKSLPRAFTCTCASKGELLYISKHDFLSKIRSEDSIKTLVDSNIARENTRYSRLMIARNLDLDFAQMSMGNSRSPLRRKKKKKKEPDFTDNFYIKKNKSEIRTKIQPLSPQEIQRIKKTSQCNSKRDKLPIVAFRLKSFSPHPHYTSFSFIDKEGELN